MADDEKGGLREQDLYEDYLDYYDLVERIEKSNCPEFIKDHYKKFPTLQIEEDQRGRAHIQAYKIKHNFPLDTPLCFHESVIDDLVQGDIAEPVREP